MRRVKLVYDSAWEGGSGRPGEVHVVPETVANRLVAEGHAVEAGSTPVDEEPEAAPARGRKGKKSSDDEDE